MENTLPPVASFGMKLTEERQPLWETSGKICQLCPYFFAHPYIFNPRPQFNAILILVLVPHLHDEKKIYRTAVYWVHWPRVTFLPEAASASPSAPPLIHNRSTSRPLAAAPHLEPLSSLYRPFIWFCPSSRNFSPHLIHPNLRTAGHSNPQSAGRNSPPCLALTWRMTN